MLQAIDECFRIVQSPVYIVTRHGGYKRCLSRSAAINNLAHYMVTKVFYRLAIETNHPMYDTEGRPIIHSIGEHTHQYLLAHDRTARRIRLILAKKRKQKEWERKHEALVDQYAELMKSKPF
ncbi:hypothetical protein [Pantoea sp. BAV 3049]|uniref:hypothetical protein n=1 Tax=Pantoea sp. BAV 3049 TaxID=2654188 RepID=UPI00131E3266|nr:hypothetical protein [Pantoea sp. BAV 3049]